MHADVKWSPACGGCLMFVNETGADCCSVGEGEFPADANGRPPSHADRALETARQHLSESPVCPARSNVEQWRSEVTPSAEDWDRAERRAQRRPPACSKCGDPSHRLPQCRTLGNDLP